VTVASESESRHRARTAGFDYTRQDLGHSPFVVFYEVTQACDLVCLHCRACAQTRPQPNELSTTDALQLLDQLRQFPKPPMVVLTGGDPLKRPDIFEIVEYGSRRGLKMSITPSATPLVTLEALRRLRDAGLVRVAVSLDAADEGTHDAFRGVAGSYRRTFEIMLAAQSLGLPVQVNTTVTPANFRQIDDMADLLAAHEIVLWSVFFLVPVGRGNALPRLAPADYEWAFERLWQNAQRQTYPIKTTEAPHYRRFVMLHDNPLLNSEDETQRRPAANWTLGINDGKGVMFVGHNGVVYPSGFLPILCGQFPRQHVVDIYQHSPLMQALRDAGRLEGKCHRCEFRKVCGGSRARAYAVTGNPFAEEPDCVYQPSAARVAQVAAAESVS
jgi:radical SAM protein